ncbi:MAG: hypothetical protein AAGA95_05980 [Pseudomonadota bacterium]
MRSIRSRLNAAVQGVDHVLEPVVGVGDQLDGLDLFILRRPEERLDLAGDTSVADRQRAVVRLAQVDVAPVKRDQLALTKTGVDTDRDRAPLRLADGVCA